MKGKIFMVGALVAAGTFCSFAQSTTASTEGQGVQLISEDNAENAVPAVQTPLRYEVGSFELEVKVGLANSLLSPPKDYKNYSQLSFGIESRHNMSDGQWAFGGELGILGTLSMHKDVDANKGIDNSRSKWTGGFYIGPVAEYDWNRGGDFSPYAGIGAGVISGYTGGIYFHPRVGFETNRYSRVGISAMLSPAGCAALNVEVGLVFGGYRK